VSRLKRDGGMKDLNQLNSRKNLESENEKKLETIIENKIKESSSDVKDNVSDLFPKITDQTGKDKDKEKEKEIKLAKPMKIKEIEV